MDSGALTHSNDYANTRITPTRYINSLDTSDYYIRAIKEVTDKGSEQPTSKALVVYDADIVAPNEQLTYLTSFETEGYTHIYIMPKATGSFAGISYILLYAFQDNLGVQVLPEPSGLPYIALNIGDVSRPDYGTAVSPKWEIYGQIIDLYIKATGEFSGHLTIAAYLLN